MIELLEQFAPASPPAAQRSIVQLDEERVIASLRAASEKKRRLPQARQDPAPDDLDPDFDLGFVARLIGPRRNDGGAVMAGEIGIGPVDHRLVKAGLGDAGLQIVADRLPGDAAEIGEGADMRGDPVRQPLAQAASA